MVFRRLTLVDELLYCLAEVTTPKDGLDYVSKEKALGTLREITGQDFDYDINAWVKWLKGVEGRSDRRYSWIAHEKEMQDDFYQSIAEVKSRRG